MEYQIKFTVELPNLFLLQFQSELSTPIADIIETISAKTGMVYSLLNLVYGGRVIKREETLSSCRIPAGATIYCIWTTYPY